MRGVDTNQSAGLVGVVGLCMFLLWPSSRRSKVEERGEGILRPLTPHESMGRYTTSRICMVSFGQSRFAFRSTACEQLYLIATPANVSVA